MRTYVGESTDKVLVKQKLNFERKQTKSPPSTHLKNTVFFILFISGVTGVVTGPCKQMYMVQSLSRYTMFSLIYNKH